MIVFLVLTVWGLPESVLGTDDVAKIKKPQQRFPVFELAKARVGQGLGSWGPLAMLNSALAATAACFQRWHARTWYGMARSGQLAALAGQGATRGENTPDNGHST